MSMFFDLHFCMHTSCDISLLHTKTFFYDFKIFDCKLEEKNTRIECINVYTLFSKMKHLDTNI